MFLMMILKTQMNKQAENTIQKISFNKIPTGVSIEKCILHRK